MKKNTGYWRETGSKLYYVSTSFREGCRQAILIPPYKPTSRAKARVHNGIFVSNEFREIETKRILLLREIKWSIHGMAYFVLCNGTKQNPPVPFPVSPLKILRHLVQLLAIRILILNADMKIHCAIVICSIFVHSVIAKSCTYVVNKRQQTELFAMLGLGLSIANSCTSLRGIFQGFSQDGGHRLIPLTARSISLDSTFKGTVSRDFLLLDFSWTSFPQASDYTIRAVSNFFENSRRYS